MPCRATTLAGTPCRAAPAAGSDLCVQHATDPELVRRRQDGARRGGARPRAPDTPPIAASPIQTDDLDLEQPAGLRTFLARVMARLATLPIDRAAANAFAQLVTAQRGTIETAHLASRLDALEAAAHDTPPLRRVG